MSEKFDRTGKMMKNVVQVAYYRQAIANMALYTTEVRKMIAAVKTDPIDAVLMDANNWGLWDVIREVLDEHKWTDEDVIAAEKEFDARPFVANDDEDENNIV